MNKVPVSFKVFQHTYDVMFDDERLSLLGLWGEANRNANAIYLCSTYKGEEISEDRLLSTLYHEIAHIILMEAGYDKLNEDEQLVNLIGELMRQVVETFEYEGE